MDGNDVDDCSETLVTNSAFDIDASGWWPESGVTVEWVSRDFDDFDDSGALQVTFTETGAGDQLLMAGAQQCLPSIDEGNYQVGSHFFRGGGQDGWAGVNILFFGEADCTGALVGSQTLPLDAGEDAWLTTQSRVAVPPTVTSLMVRLVAIKPANAASLVVLFDGILARQK